MEYVDAKKLRSEVERIKEAGCESPISVCNDILSFIDYLQDEQSEDISLIKHWFEHIAQIADDRKTLTGEVMEDSYALDEIKSIAKNSVYYIEHHAHTLGLENARKEE